MRMQIILFCLIWLSATLSYADSLPELEEVIENTMPSIVTITTYKKNDQKPEEDSNIVIPPNLLHLFESKEKSEVLDQTGTGFFISRKGYIMTCLHLVMHAEKIQVLLFDKRKFTATLVASDPVSDLALLKIKGENFSALDFETAKLPRTGAWVFVIGAPYGFDFSTNVGIVSANNRTLNLRDGTESIPYIQTSISINPGHSGGPVVNLSGKVVGITTHIFTDQPGSIGISFAVPAFYAEQLSKKWLYDVKTKVGS